MYAYPGLFDLDLGRYYYEFDIWQPLSNSVFMFVWLKMKGAKQAS